MAVIEHLFPDVSDSITLKFLEDFEDLGHIIVNLDMSMLNPKTTRIAFVKLDALHSYNISGESTYGGRNSWAKSNGDRLHEYINYLKRHVKSKAVPRWPVLKRLKDAYQGAAISHQNENAAQSSSSGNLPQETSLSFPTIPAHR